MAQAAEDATDDAPSRSDIGRAIHVLRWNRDWSLDDMAARSGISAASLGRYENGITQPTVGRLEAIARAFGLGVADLFRAADTYSGTGLYLNALAASAA